MQILLTGVTGFVGKVVLEELLRQRYGTEGSLEKIQVLIRPKRQKSAQERFEQDVVPSPCFAALPSDWPQQIEVISGELSQPQLGLTVSDVERLQAQLSHVINCAASVDFDLPLAEAAMANITSALNMLELARGCRHLQAFVNVSTAYVTPHPGEGVSVPEALVPLPFDSEAIYAQILAGTANQKALLAQTGHPNTYTFTKCLSEDLLARRRGEVPLAIVRPSIISASWQYPHPGWIDSHAAFAGFVALIGAGLLKAVAADDNTVLDIVPCDEVAQRILDTAFWPAERGPRPLIQHIVSGVHRGCRVDTSIAGIESYFRRHPVQAWPELRFVSNGRSVDYPHWRHHVLPLQLAQTWFGLLGKARQKRRLQKLLDKMAYLNAAFPYFTHKTFAFEMGTALSIPAFEPRQYIERVCRGVHEYLMQHKARELVLGGEQHRHPHADRRWARQQPLGNWAIRAAAYLVRKGFRKACSQISFDRHSFEVARTQMDPNGLLVLVPTHRSYMDFLVCSYLFFAHPELNIPIPQIAAAREFATLPFLGWFFQQTHAFYIQRGRGKDPELTQKIQNLVAENKTLEFFIEGTRSRSRQFLEPKRGLLRALQETEVPCTLLPIAISYDRVPEEAAFLTELQGGTKPQMKLKPLLNWLLQLAQGKVDLGRVHLVCGQPVRLEPGQDVHTVGHTVVGELQDKTVVTRFHLQAFLYQHPELQSKLDLEALEALIAARGGTVLASSLAMPDKVDALSEFTFRYQWMHLFYPDLLAFCPQHPAVLAHVHSNAFAPHLCQSRQENPAQDPVLSELLLALFAPLAQTYHQVLHLAERHQGLPWSNARSLVAQHAGAYLPLVREALAHFSQVGLLQPQEQGYVLGPTWKETVTDYVFPQWETLSQEAQLV